MDVRIAIAAVLVIVPSLRAEFTPEQLSILKRMDMLIEQGAWPRKNLAEFKGLVAANPGLINGQAPGARSTLLGRCAMEGEPRFSNVLLAAGADPNLRDAEGYAPLHRGHHYTSQSDVILQLIANGADTRLAGPMGDSPLHIAVRRGINLTGVHVLLDNGADPHVTNEAGQTPLHVLASSEAVAANYDAFIAHWLLRAKANPAIQDKNGKTAGEIAAEKNVNVAKVLAGTRPVLPKDQVTEMTFEKALQSDSVGLCRAMLESDRGLIRFKDAHGFQAIHIASIRAGCAMIDLLIQHGASINEAVRAPKNSPSGGAGDTKTPLHFAAIRDRPDVIAFMVEKKADVTASDASGVTPLHEACAAVNPAPDSVAALLKARAKVDARDKNLQTPLHVLCQRTRNLRGKPDELADALRVLKLLLDANAPLLATTKSGDTPLHCAVMGGDPEFIRALVKKGVPITAKNRRGQTPVDLAQNNQELVNALRAR